ncbi:MAG: hypothetical protein CNE98_00125 [Bacteroidetes bacterium MED-G17]|nr:MAG: hypothetical protein CNE98_00125 [Bacteroidetes bacterium MED-G17]
MRYSLALITIVIVLTACSRQTEIKTNIVENSATLQNPEELNRLAKFKFEETEVDFGSINEGEIVEHTFKFKNVGNEDLIITNVQTSCGCTASNWPRNAISPGETSELLVSFNSQGKKGLNTKEITVIGNTRPTQTILIIKANVNPN